MEDTGLGRNIQRFWQCHPALLYGIFLYCAVWAALQPSWIVGVPILFLIIAQSPKRLLLPLMAAGSMYCGTLARVQLPPDDMEACSGTALVTVEELSQGIRYGTPYWKLRLYVHQFSGEEKGRSLYGIPCTATWKDLSCLPNTGCYYRVSGTLKRLDTACFTFQPARNAKWETQEHRFSLSDRRLKAKMSFKQYLRAHLPPGEARLFLEGLLLGEFHDQILAENLRRFGLTHIMVVSGFHFSLIAAFIATLLRFSAAWTLGSWVSISWKGAIIVLLMATTGYFLFIGPSPSVMRAWISTTILLIGKLLERQSNGLNSLGIALIALLFYEPLFALHIGFQLSFLATGAILLFYSPFDHWLGQLFVKRRVVHVLALPPFDQAGHFLVVYFRKAWALNLAVHVCMVPMILYTFHSFPLLGIIYNLFFPFGVAICLSLLCFCCLISWIPWVAMPLFQFCNSMTDALLTVVSYAPRSLDKIITVDSLPAWLIVTYLSMLLLFAVWLGTEKKQPIISLF